MAQRYIQIGAWNAFLAVALGAFGAHILEERLTVDMLDTFQTGTHYHLIHAIGLLCVAFILDRNPQNNALLWSARLLFAGILIFSGSLYVLALSGITVLGAITPFGGVAFLSGWAMLAFGIRNKK